MMTFAVMESRHGLEFLDRVVERLTAYQRGRIDVFRQEILRLLERFQIRPRETYNSSPSLWPADAQLGNPRNHSDH